MSSRIRKQKKLLSVPIVKPSSLLAAVLTDRTEMPSYSNYEKYGFSSCEVSPLESSRCARCIQSNRSGCNMLGATPSQFQNIVSQHTRLEAELEEVLDRITRLQQQKKLWWQWIIYAISRGVSNLEELGCVKEEKRA
jgi:hypothetical protein